MNLQVTEPLNPMQGYATFYGVSGTDPVIFSGNVNTEEVSIELTASTIPPSINENNINLIGNPYTSNIDWNLVQLPPETAKALYLWDPIELKYKYYVNGIGNASNIISPITSFFVRTSGNCQLTFTNEIRTNDTIPYFGDIDSLLVLNIMGNDKSDKTYIHFNNNATENFDPDYDALKLKFYDVPNLFIRGNYEII